MIPENIEALQKESLIRIVDDDAEIRETLSLMLEIEGWRTCAYPGAQEFLVNDQPSMPGALLLDIEMGGMNGLDLQIEMMERGYSLPVIFITGHASVDAAVDGARAAYIGGCKGTACTLTDQLYGVPAGGTMAHSWVQMFPSEYEAFKAYCETYPDNPTLLVDTYNTLKSGIPNAIRVFNEVLKPRGLTKCGIRLDSGDMTYLTKKARKLLDEAGWQSCKISCSNSLDEYIIEDILNQGAQIDLFGVGERLITAKSEAVFGGVYKLTAIEDENGTIIPKIKISENVGKITNPHFKKVYRFFGNDTGKAIADYLCVHDETVDDSSDLEIFDPQATWKRKRVYNFTAKELLVPIFKNGELVYKLPKLDDIQKYCAEQVDTLWDEVKRFDNPHTYYVDLSQKLWDIKDRLLHEGGRLDR